MQPTPTQANTHTHKRATHTGAQKNTSTHTSAIGPSGARPAPPLPKDPPKGHAREYRRTHIHKHSQSYKADTDTDTDTGTGTGTGTNTQSNTHAHTENKEENIQKQETYKRASRSLTQTGLCWLIRFGAGGLGSSWRSWAPSCRQVVARWREDGAKMA